MTDRVIIVSTAALLGAACWSGARDQDSGRSGARHAMSERAAAEGPRDRRGVDYRDFTIAAGTPLRVALASRISSDRSKAEDRVRGVLREPVRAGGVSVLPEGALLEGSVLEVERAGSTNGRAYVAFHFTKVAVYGETHSIDATRLAYSAEPTRQGDRFKTGTQRGAGTRPWDRKGAATGAGSVPAGTRVVLATRGDDATLPPGTVVTIRLNAPLTVRMALD